MPTANGLAVPSCDQRPHLRYQASDGFIQIRINSMFRLIRYAIIFCFGLSCSLVPADDPKFVVAGYLPDYRIADWSREAGPVTDLIMFGMSAPADGVFDATAIAKQHVSVAQNVGSCSRL